MTVLSAVSWTSCCLVTAGMKTSRSSVWKTESLVAVTVAVRGTARSRAISPKTSPGPRCAMWRPSLVTSTDPLSTK